MRIKKRAFTLLEVVISLSLLTLLLTTLLFWYSHLTKNKIEIQHKKPKLTQQYYAYSKLEQLFHRLTNLSTRHEPLFFSDLELDLTPSLTFYFDYGVNEDPLFSDKVLGKLSLEQGALLLTIWPNKENHALTSACQHIVILEDVKQLHFRFLSPKKVNFLTVFPPHISPDLPTAGWYDQWPLELKALPALVEVCIQTDQEHKWMFDLQLPLLYPVDIT